MPQLAESLKEEINKIILEEIIENGLLHIEKILPEHRILDDLELDMMSLICVVINIESHFDITIPDYDAEICKTVNDFYELVYRIKYK